MNCTKKVEKDCVGCYEDQHVFATLGMIDLVSKTFQMAGLAYKSEP